MADYYFAPAPLGDDANAGTFIDPWETPQKALDEVAAGDTCHFADGTYTITATVTAMTTGTVGNVITIQATNSRGAIWDVNNANVARNLNATDMDYYVFDGIVFEGNEVLEVSRSIQLETCDHFTFTDCEIFNTWGYGIRADYCDFLTITDCEIHHEISHDPGGGFDVSRDGILARDGENLIITGTEVYNTSHLGIAIYGGTTTLIDDCYIHDTSSHAIWLGDGSSGPLDTLDVTVSYCRIDRAGTYAFEPRSKRGIVVAQNTGGILLLRNQIWDSDGQGIQVERTAIGPVYIYHNTLVNNSTDSGSDYGEISATDSDGDSLEPEIIIRNNIIYHEVSNVFFRFDQDARIGLTIDYNCEYDNDGDITSIIIIGDATYNTFAAYAGGGWEPNSQLNADPLFTNRGAEDFTLQAGSPALNAGVDLGLPYYGAAPDMGYWEYWGDPPPTEPSVATGVMVG